MIVKTRIHDGQQPCKMPGIFTYTHGPGSINHLGFLASRPVMEGEMEVERLTLCQKQNP